MTIAGARNVRRLTGAVPLLLAAVVFAALAALVSPAVRHQLAVSFSRQSTPYVELYLDDATGARGCPVSAGPLPIAATLRSHLDAPATLGWTATVTTAGGTVRAKTAGTLTTRPGGSVPITAVVAVPARRAYTVTLGLTGRREHLILHCGTTGATP